MTSDLIVDPIHDGATDPVLVWNHASSEWWCLFGSGGLQWTHSGGSEWLH